MKKILFLLIIAGLIAGIYFTQKNNKAAQNNGLNLTGNIEITESDVGFKIPGRIIALHVDEGDRVKSGDIIARIDDEELSKTVEQAKAVLSEAEIRLEELKKGSRSQEIGQAKASLNATEADLIKAKNDFDRAQNLFNEGTISKHEFDAAKRSYDAAQSLKTNASEKLSLVKEGPRKEEIKAASAKVQQAKSALAIAEQKLNETIIYSPINGVVLKKMFEKGEIVSAGTAIFTIGNLDDPWIKVYVKEDKLGYVKLGQKANVTVDAYPGKIYSGVISYISSEAEFTPKNIQTREERVKLVFAIKVKVQNINDELKPGMPADVEIIEGK